MANNSVWKPITISDFSPGIGKSPNVGFGEIFNMDHNTVPGTLANNFKTTLSLTTTDLVKWFKPYISPTGAKSFFGYGDTGILYRNINSVWHVVPGYSTSNADGDGLGVAFDYVFVARNAALDVYGPLSGAASTGGTVTKSGAAVTGSGTTFTSDLAAGDAMIVNGEVYYVLSVTDNTNLTLTSSSGTAFSGATFTTINWTHNFQSLDFTGTAPVTAWHPMLFGDDNILYIGNKQKVASLEEVTTFDPADAGSYTWNPNALDLPEGRKVRCLEQLGNNLMVGTYMGNLPNDIMVAEIFPWNRTEDSFNLPIKLQEFGVSAMLTMNNVLFIVAGIQGSVYVTNGSSTELVREIPRTITGLTGGTFTYVYPGAIMARYGQIHWGLSTGSTSADFQGFGVWSISQNGAIFFENQISTGTNAGTTELQIGALLPIGSDSYYIGWKNNTSYGIDVVDTSARYESYYAHSDSPLMRVGTIVTPRQFSEVIITLDRPLLTGQSVRIKYRPSLSSSFTEIATQSYSAADSVLAFTVPANMEPLVNLQLRLELSGSTPVYLREIQLI